MDTFSKGMKQKVLLIAGIIHNPKIIVLDEPLSGLDANAVIMIKELIMRLSGRQDHFLLLAYDGCGGKSVRPDTAYQQRRDHS